MLLLLIMNIVLQFQMVAYAYVDIHYWGDRQDIMYFHQWSIYENRLVTEW